MVGTAINTPFFDHFPTMEYDINNIKRITTGSHDTVRDIFFRFGIIKNVMNNLTNYYVYDIEDSDTPEILAEKIYGDAGAGWMIIYANKIFDPQFDWPLKYDAFRKMIIDKYGSVENSQITNHHAEMVVTRTNDFFETVDVTRFIVDNTRLTGNNIEAPYRYYTPYTITTFRTADSGEYTADDEQVPFLTADLDYDDAQVIYRRGSLSYSTETNTYQIDGHTVVETVRGESISCYDYELRLNDAKKQIKIIKNDHYFEIMNEFKILVNTKDRITRTLV